MKYQLALGGEGGCLFAQTFHIPDDLVNGDDVALEAAINFMSAALCERRAWRGASKNYSPHPQPVG
jgi:hypothetical protein